jgi:hypothetical protein
VRAPQEPEEPPEDDSVGSGRPSQSEIDYTQTEGQPTSYASLEARLTLLVGNIAGKFQMPKDVVLPAIGLLACVGLAFFALTTFSVESWPILIGVAVFGLLIMAGSFWANTKILNTEKPKKHTRWTKRNK